MAGHPGRSSSPALRRLIAMLALLNDAGDDGLPAAEFVQRIGYVGEPASQREMLKRDINALVGQGWQIDNTAPAGHPAVYRLRRGDPRVRLTFTGAERREFDRAAQLAGVNIARAAESVATADLQVAVRRAPAFTLERLLHAHEHRCLIHFPYRDKHRTVASDAIRIESGQWYLVGREQGSEQPKYFRLDRMGEVSLDPPGTAGSAHDWPELTANPLSFRDGPEVTAVVLVHPDFRSTTERALGPATSVRRMDDELVLEIPVISHTTFLRRLCELDTRVRLLGPESLRQELRSALEPFVGQH